MLPDVAVRQWVLSVPHEIRRLLAAKAAVLSSVVRIASIAAEVGRRVQVFLRRRGLIHDQPDDAADEERSALDFCVQVGLSRGEFVRLDEQADDASCPTESVADIGMRCRYEAVGRRSPLLVDSPCSEGVPVFRFPPSVVGEELAATSVRLDALMKRMLTPANRKAYP